MSEAYAGELRRAYPRVLARVLGFTQNLPEAEDAVQEAVLRALSAWPGRGVPASPEAWLHAVAANVHRDRLRRVRREGPVERVDQPTRALEALALRSPWVQVAVGEPDIERAWKDELLRLVFACCHPALATGESAALCLATVVGLSVDEVAAAFVVEPRAMEQRLTRARRRLRERGDPDGTSPARARERLPAALCVIHLLFNEGYWSRDAASPIRASLCRLAIGLAAALLELFPREPEVLGLLSLLTLHDARRPARLGPDGQPVPLPEQDRARWDQRAIAHGLQLLDAALADPPAALTDEQVPPRGRVPDAGSSHGGRPGPLVIEAAISAVHCQAASAGDTDWHELAALYALLEAHRPTPAVRVNRAFSVARAEGAGAGLALLDTTGAGEPDVDSYPYAHLVRGTLLAELGATGAARASLERALQVAQNPAERAQITAHLSRLPEDDRAGAVEGDR